MFFRKSFDADGIISRRKIHWYPFLTACAAMVSMAAVSSIAQVTYSNTGWTSWSGAGPWGNTLHLSSTANATASITMTGTEAFVVHKIGPDCGIMDVVVDGRAASMKEIDTYQASAVWNKKTVIASNLAQGTHTVVITVTGRKNTASADSLVQIVDKWTPAVGQWSCERAWEWYKARPWIVGWNYMPSTCVNSTEWWQDETHVTDSIIERELGLGEQLGYNSIITYIQYIVWRKDSVYQKTRFSRFLTLAAKHHFLVAPVLFDDINFGQKKPFLGDQGAPVPGQLMSQWTPSPGPVIAMDTAQWPHLKSFVQDMVSTYGQDSRILMWDVYNEPSPDTAINDFTLVGNVFAWAREKNPSQPLVCSEWRGCQNLWPYDLADITSTHGYFGNTELQSRIDCMKPTQRPLIFTEWLARSYGSRIATDLPLFKRNGVWNYSWGLINGRMQCQYPWNNPVNGPVPAVGWFQDILYNNGTPYRAAEVDAIRRNLAHKVINWVAGATDGSIVQKAGCTDPRYSEYDSMATVPGTCATLLPALVIPGCLDSTSKNFTPLATINDTAICNAANPVILVAAAKEVRGAAFRFIGNNRIRIFEKGVVHIELFSSYGTMVWHGTGDGPCIIKMNRSLKNGIYFVRLSRNGGNTYPILLF